MRGGVHDMRGGSYGGCYDDSIAGSDLLAHVTPIYDSHL